MRRVAVIGNSGGGKSVLARQLAASLNLPYVELDADREWLPEIRQLTALEGRRGEHVILLTYLAEVEGFASSDLAR